MKRYMNFVVYFAITLLLIGCGERTVSILDETAGVWRAQGDGAMVSIIYSDKKLSLLINDSAIPVSLGNIDTMNKTINLKVTRFDGKPGIWTLKQIWDEEQKTFHLSLTLDDGTQDELSFIRKISSDDLNKLTNISTTNKSASISDRITTESVTAIKQEDITTSSMTPVQTVSQQHATAPSFNCSKASNFVEKTICAEPLLGKLDNALSENYKYMLASNIGEGARGDLKVSQKKWLTERNACANSDCLVDKYRKRVNEVCEYPVLSGIHPICIYSDEIN